MKISNSNVANTVHKRISRNNIFLFGALLAGAVLSGCGGGGGGAGASDVPVQQTKAIVGQPGSEGYALNSAEIGRLYGPGIFRQDALGNTMIGINGSQERIIPRWPTVAGQCPVLPVCTAAVMAHHLAESAGTAAAAPAAARR